MTVAVAVVASGATVSSVITALGGHVSIVSPACTSCQAFLQAATTTTSADFSRLRFSTTTASDWAWPVGSLSNTLTVPYDVAGVFPYFRIETGVAQSDARSFSIVQARSR